jgi:hypothetical protein
MRRSDTATAKYMSALRSARAGYLHGDGVAKLRQRIST